jgi:hypothetical protein
VIIFIYLSDYSYYFNSWLSPLLKKSRKQGTLHLNDLYDLPDYLTSTALTDKLEANWFDELKRYPQKPSLIRATLRTLGWTPFLLGFLEVLNVSRLLFIIKTNRQVFYDMKNTLILLLHRDSFAFHSHCY